MPGLRPIGVSGSHCLVWFSKKRVIQSRTLRVRSTGLAAIRNAIESELAAEGAGVVHQSSDKEFRLDLWTSGRLDLWVAR